MLPKVMRELIVKRMTRAIRRALAVAVAADIPGAAEIVRRPRSATRYRPTASKD